MTPLLEQEIAERKVKLAALEKPEPVAWRTWSSEWHDWQYSTTPFEPGVDVEPLYLGDKHGNS